MIHIEDNHNIGYSKITLTGDTLNYLIDIIRWLETNEVPLLNSSNGKNYTVQINSSTFDLEYCLIATSFSNEKRMLFKLTFS